MTVGILGSGFGLFCEIYDIALTPYLPTGLVRSGVFSAGRSGLFGSDAATFIAATFSGLWIGTLMLAGAADRWGRLPVLRWSLVLYSATSLLTGLQSSALGVDVLRFFTGLGMGVQIIAIDCLLAEVVPKAIRGRAFALSTAIQLFAAPAAAIMALVLVPRSPMGIEGWRWLSFMPVLLGCVVLLLQRRLVESPRWLALAGRTADAERVVAAIEMRVTARRAPAVAGPAPARKPSAELDIDRREYVKRLCFMSVANFMQAIGYFGFMNWVPSLLQARGANLSQSLGYSAAIAISFPMAPLIFFLFADKFERKYQLMSGLLGAAVFGVLFSRQSTPAMWIVFGVLVTVSSNLMAFSQHAYQSEIFPTQSRSRAVGFVYSFTRLSTIFSGYVVAFLLRAYGVGSVFVFLDGSLVVAALAVGVFGPRTRRRALEDIA